MSRYNTVRIIKDRDFEKQMYVNNKYPTPPLDSNDIYVYASDTDRYDVLANKFYGDPRLWYVISLANAESNANMASLYPPVGKRIRIPINYTTFESLYMASNRLGVRTEISNPAKMMRTGYTRNTHN